MRIHTSENTRNLLNNHQDFLLEERGELQIKVRKVSDFPVRMYNLATFELHASTHWISTTFNIFYTCISKLVFILKGINNILKGVFIILIKMMPICM